MAGLKLEHVLDSVMAIIRRLRQCLKRPSGLISIKDLVERSLEKLLPSDAHLRCSGRLGVSVTRLGWPSENKFISEFRSREDLIEAICAGCFIPLWSGSLWPPKFRGESFVDGAYSNNTPRFELTTPDERRTIRQVEVSPFSGGVEVSPPDGSALAQWRVMGSMYKCNWNNIVRTIHAILPFPISKYKIHFVGGHRDMKDFVLRNNLIKCRQCCGSLLTSGNESVILTPADKKKPSAKPCIACLKLMEQVDSLSVSKEMLRILDD